MPLYEYCCEKHGVFDALVPLSKSHEPAQCPVCGEACARVMSVPFTGVLDNATRRATAINERSQNEPYRYSDLAKEAPPTPPVQKVHQSSGARPWMMG